ncbi:MAG: HD domain-containing protein [Chlorobi bacterium]|nr:HD domain-containing protein [Chlorobiota bacterium]
MELKKLDFEGVEKLVLKKLKTELPTGLHYHSIDHTLDVKEAAERLAKMENINGHDLELLKTAALFHDLGFIKTYDGHEKVSAAYAHEILPGFGYSPKDIKLIEGMILATEIPQSPVSHLEKIMADADLDYIGRDDLFLIGQRLQYEWKLYGKISTLKQWHETQLGFLKAHSFFTESAKKLRKSKKQENIREIEKLLCIEK